MTARLANPSRPAVPRPAAARMPDGVEEHLRHVQRMVMQGELAASAVHEISNLLTIVLFNASLLRELLKGEPARQKYIEPLLHAATMIVALCGQLRNLSRPIQPQSQVIDLVDAARGTFRLLQQIMTRELVFTAPAGGPVFVYADPAHIDQVLVNLVLNARDATRDSDGRISVRVGRRAGAGSYIEVRDNGSGMTAAVRRRIFKTFFTTKPPGLGSGLGLVTVQRLMHGLGGDIGLRSRPGRGTCVRLLFPAPGVPAEPPLSPGEAITPDPSGQPG